LSVRLAGVLPVLLGACLSLLPACSEDDENPVGAGLLPVIGDTIGEVTLEPVQAESFLTGTSDRSFGQLLTAAHDFPAPDGFESRVLIRFNLTPADTALGRVRVDSARVRLNVTNVQPDSVAFSLFRVTESWVEEEVSWEDRAFGLPWSAPGGAFDPAPVARGVVIADTISVAVPDTLVQRWLDDPDSNDGFVLLLDDPAAYVQLTAASTTGLANEFGPLLRLFVTVNDGSSVSSVIATADAYIATFEGSVLDGLGAGNEPFLRTLLRFNLSAVPPNASINLAELRVTPRQVVALDSLQIELRRVVSPFLGGATVFSTLLLDLVRVEADSALVFSNPGLASLVRLWQADSTLNLGVGLQAQRRFGNLGFVILAGPEAAPASRPQLRVIFTPGLRPDIPRSAR
jgi:hypothetical protein